MQQQTKMSNPKQEYFGKFPYFFTLFQNRKLKCLSLPFCSLELKIKSYELIEEV